MDRSTTGDGNIQSRKSSKVFTTIKGNQSYALSFLVNTHNRYKNSFENSAEYQLYLDYANWVNLKGLQNGCWFFKLVANPLYKFDINDVADINTCFQLILFVRRVENSEAVKIYSTVFIIYRSQCLHNFNQFLASHKCCGEDLKEKPVRGWANERTKNIQRTKKAKSQKQKEQRKKRGETCKIT